MKSYNFETREVHKWTGLTWL